MKSIMKALMAVVIGMMAMSVALADGTAPKDVKGYVTVTKGTDGKTTGVSIASDVGTITVSADAYSKFETFDKKKVEVSVIQKDGKYLLAPGATPKAVTDKADTKIKADKTKKM